MVRRIAVHARRRVSDPRARVSRVEIFFVLAAALLVLSGIVVSAATTHSAEGASAQPPPTRTPKAPALMLATSSSEDLAGAWLEPAGSQYLLFVSTAFGDPRKNVPVLVGRPGAWSAPVDALPTPPPWALSVTRDGTTWQPEVHRFGSRYVLYYSGLVKGTRPDVHCLGTAVSATLIGPYTPMVKPIVCQRKEGGDIDGQVVVDTTTSDRRTYLVWKSDNNSSRGHGTDLIWSQPLATDGLSVVGSPTVIYGTDQAPKWADPIVEAPQMETSPFGGWWLFYSGGGGFTEPNYAMGVARCQSISGPCTPVGTQPLIKSNEQGSGVGEESFFRSAGSDWLLYSPWHSGIAYDWFRPIAAARIGWTPGGPYVAQAGSFPAP
jgi:hypothetical protein